MTKLILFVSLFHLFEFCWAQQNPQLDSLATMTLDELLSKEVKTSSLTRLKIQNAPASVTTITSNDIACTPARNVYDLIEIFVPGAIWANHYDGPHIGIRSAPSDRNYKYILLFDGVNLNQKSLNGMSSELENWDLDDIEKIEIVRGPGAVTYGPGATMGVVNIVSKKASIGNRFEANTRFAFPYNSRGANVSYSTAKENFKLYSFASIIDLPGYQNADMFRVEQDKATKQFHYGLIGKGQQYIDGINVGDAPPLSYLRSETPQIKLHLGMTIAKEWDVMIRYTTSDVIGQYVFPQMRPVSDVIISDSEIDANGVHQQGKVKWGDYTDYGYVKHHVFSSAIKNAHTFNQHFELSSKLSWYMHDYEFGWNDYYYSNISNFESIVKYHELGSLTNPVNKTSELGRNWSENEFCGTQILNWTPTARTKFAIGGEVSHTTIQKGWGDAKRDFIAGESWNFFSDANSAYIQTDTTIKLAAQSKQLKDAVLVGDGFGITTYSAMIEANVQIARKLTLVASGRTDKNSYIKWLVSPRCALIAEIDKHNTVKVLAQRSQRMNTMGQLYLEKLQNTESDNESLTSFEVIYSFLLGKKVDISLPIFFNEMDNIGVEKDNNGSIATKLLGRYRCWGVEPELRFMVQGLQVGLNHSIYVPISWKLYEKATGRNLTSVGDWDYTTDSGLKLRSTTANSMCWSNQTTKLWVNYRINPKLSVHLDARCYWSFEGGKDMLKMWDDAVKGTSYEKEYTALTAELNRQNVYGADFRMNIGLSYDILPSSTFTVSGMNLISATGNKRYSLWEFWNQYPTMAYVKEPLMISAKLQVRLGAGQRQ